MGKKVTGGQLKTLIERVTMNGLKDKVYDTRKMDYDTKEPDIEDLAQNDDDDTAISQTDVTQAYVDDNESEKSAAQFLAKSLKKGRDAEKMINYVTNAVTDAAEFTAGDAQSIDSEEIRSLAFKQLQTVSADPDDSETAVGKFPEGIATTMNTIFSGVNTFRERLIKLKEVCESAINNRGTVSQGETPTSALANMLVLDYVTTLVREVDSGAGAYNFEAFLALLVGGRVVGKETNPAGEMGGADFRSADGSAGSSKYYSRMSGIEQSSKGFREGEPVFYVIAIKQREDKADDETNRPTNITSLNIYTLFVVKIASDVRNKDIFAYKYSNGEVEIKSVETGGKINLSTGLSSKGEPLNIRLVTTSTEEQKDIRRVVDAIIRDRTETQEDQVAQAVKQFKTLSDSLYTAGEKSQAYASTGDIDKGNAALENLEAADGALLELARIIAGEEKVDSDTRKITKEHFIKLISESFNK
jgi:hypothetical protein